ncbi:MAG: hypothetical protein ACLU99_09015 [Alphaproteobacteria bacterium]
MIFKQAQIDKYLKKNDPAIKAFVVYGSNEGLVAEYVKKLAATVSADLYDPFQVVYLNGSDVNADPGTLFSEYTSQSLMGGRRVIIIKDADNNLTKHFKVLLEGTPSDTLVIAGSGSLNKNLLWFLWGKAATIWRLSLVMKIVTKMFLRRQGRCSARTE